MTDSRNLLNVWRMSKAMHCRPSAVIRVEDSWGSFAAYCFDSAVVHWGTSFDAALQEAASNAKTAQAAEHAQGRVLRRWVDLGTAAYADPNRM